MFCKCARRTKTVTLRFRWAFSISPAGSQVGQSADMLQSFKANVLAVEREFRVMRALEEKYGAKLVNGRIGGGTEKAVLATEYLIEVQLAGTPLVKVLEGEA